MEHVNTLCGKNGEFPNVTGSSIYIYIYLLHGFKDFRRFTSIGGKFVDVSKVPSFPSLST
jgi:hypothetical protein